MLQEYTQSSFSANSRHILHGTFLDDIIL